MLVGYIDLPGKDTNVSQVYVTKEGVLKLEKEIRKVYET